ncbi:MAG: hypothetical protein ACTHMZ_02040, partial [Actinomycetes bacterium]
AITEGPVPASYPGPAMPNLPQAQLSPAQLRSIVESVLAAGVGSGGTGDTDWGQPHVADAATTDVTVRVGTGYATASVYALSEAEQGDNGLTPAQQRRRQALLTAIERAGAARVATTGYRAKRGAVIARPETGTETDPGTGTGTDIDTDQPESGLPTPQTQVWSGPSPTTGTTAGLPEGWHCLLLDAAQWASLRPSLADSNQLTRWLADGREWHFVVRPLLPDERGCADLT